MARTAAGLKTALKRIPELREEFWHNVTVPGENEELNQALERAGLAHKPGQAARTLSGGEQQRLVIARAAALKPDVLLLDEPCSNLDPEAVRGIEDLIRSVGNAGTKIIMTTHDIAQARRLGDDVLFLHRGSLLEHAPASRFFESPSHPAAARFLDGALLA